MTENEFTYWAFLSFSPQDNCVQRPGAPAGGNLCWCDWLREALNAFPIPAEFAGQINARGEIIPERIEPVFQAPEEQPGNASLSENARQALEQSRCLIVICSPRSAKSLQVNEAVRYFKQLGRGHRILPLIVAGEPNASDGNQPGSSPEDECFVPALRFPVNADGTLDTTRRDRGSISADARHGEDKREILASDLQNAETKLEIARIQLIAGLLGVGFNGLWRREQRRRFAAVQIQAREASQQAREMQTQVQAARTQAQEAQAKVLEAQAQARAAEHQAEAARNQALELQAQVQAARLQAQEAQNKVLKAEEQAREAQHQAQEARSQAQQAQSNDLEAQHQARDTEQQVQDTRAQTLELQHLVQAARKQAEAAQAKVLEAQQQAREAQQQAQEARTQALELQNQVQAARTQAEAAEKKVLEAEQQALAAQNQVLAARNESRQVPSRAPDVQPQARATEAQAQEAQDQAQLAQSKVLEAQHQAQEAQKEVQELQDQSRETQSQLQEARRQVQAAQDRAQVARSQVQEMRNKTRLARRLTKIFALLAVLALLAAGIAWRQRKLASPTLAKAVPVEASEFNLAPGKLNREQIQQALQKIGGAEQDANRRRNLDELAARIPSEEIPEALKASAIILDDRLRSHFHKQVLVRLAAADPRSAIDSASTIQGKIINDEGLSDSQSYFQFTVLDHWMQTDLPGALGWVRQLPDGDTRQRAWEKLIPALAADNPQNTLALLNDLKPAPGERSYLLLFQRWATNNPVQAIEQRQQIPDPEIGDRVLGAILTVWAEKQPEAAWNWAKAQPDSDSKNQAMETCIWSQAKTDVPKALALAELLPEGTWRNAVMADLFRGWAAKDLEAATTACQQLPNGLAKSKAWEYVLSRRIEINPAFAAPYVTNLTAGDYRQHAMNELCNHWADTNTPAVLAWAQALPSGTEQIAAFDQIVPNWTRKDPQAAIQFANQHPELSGEALGGMAVAWSQSDLNAATNWVESLPEGEKQDAALLSLAGSFAERVPTLAANFCSLLTTTQPKAELAQAIARAWAKADLPSAVEWACSLQADPARQAALSVLSETWSQKDPEGLASYAFGLPAGAAQTQYLTTACQQLALRDLPETVELLNQLADGETRRSILEQAVRGCDLPHLEQAAKYIAGMPAGEDQKAAIQGLLANWTPADPEAAINWLASFPEDNPQTEPMQSVIKAWAHSEPAAVAKWLTNSPAATTGDETISAFLGGAAEKFPEFAAQWTESVTNETKRQQYQLQVARQWLKIAPAAAQEWINRLNLPEDLKQPLRAQLP